MCESCVARWCVSIARVFSRTGDFEHMAYDDGTWFSRRLWDIAVTAVEHGGERYWGEVGMVSYVKAITATTTILATTTTTTMARTITYT